MSKTYASNIRNASYSLNQSDVFEHCDPNEWLSIVPAYFELRIWTMPIREKVPFLKGYQFRSKGYDANIANALIEKLDEAQCAIYMRQNGICVVDLDDDEPDFLQAALEAFGYTPVIIKTRRGFHLYYAADSSVKARSGPKIDLKAGEAGYVVAPLTEHSEGRYEFCSPEFMELSDSHALALFGWFIRNKALPLIQQNTASERLLKFKSDMGGNYVQEPQSAPEAIYCVSNVSSFNGEVFEGRRNRFLWTQALLLVKQTGADFELLLSRLLEVNTAHCKPPYPDGELKRIVSWAVGIEERGKNRFNSRSSNKVCRDVALSKEQCVLLRGNKNALSVFIAVLNQNDPKSSFALTPEFINEVTGRKCSNGTLRAATCKKLIELGLVVKVRNSICRKQVELFMLSEVVMSNEMNLKIVEQ